ncbi:MAG: hypothetical protein ACOCSD_05410 [Halolamina sp.]
MLVTLALLVGGYVWLRHAVDGAVESGLADYEDRLDRLDAVEAARDSGQDDWDAGGGDDSAGGDRPD